MTFAPSAAAGRRARARQRAEMAARTIDTTARIDEIIATATDPDVRAWWVELRDDRARRLAADQGESPHHDHHQH